MIEKNSVSVHCPTNTFNVIFRLNFFFFGVYFCDKPV